jgi:protease I
MNPDKLRLDPAAVAFAKAFSTANKPVGAPWTLIEADVVRDRSLTSWLSLRTDLRNIGAHWYDKEVIEDGNLVTSRKPEDIPAFNAKIIDLFSRTGTDKSRRRPEERHPIHPESSRRQERPPTP